MLKYLIFLLAIPIGYSVYKYARPTTPELIECISDVKLPDDYQLTTEEKKQEGDKRSTIFSIKIRQSSLSNLISSIKSSKHFRQDCKTKIINKTLGSYAEWCYQEGKYNFHAEKNYTNYAMRLDSSNLSLEFRAFNH
jgi:hypothetical protein